VRKGGDGEEREGEKILSQKLRERKDKENEIFWCLNQINILSRATTKSPLP
jgi:hypothetical protein